MIWLTQAKSQLPFLYRKKGFRRDMGMDPKFFITAFLCISIEIRTPHFGRILSAGEQEEGGTLHFRGKAVWFFDEGSEDYTPDINSVLYHSGFDSITSLPHSVIFSQCEGQFSINFFRGDASWIANGKLRKEDDAVIACDSQLVWHERKESFTNS